jgi:hypothetical protein
MPPSSTIDAPAWAEKTFGSAVLGDTRRGPRAVRLGAAMLANPAAHLPQQLASRAELTATYQRLHESDVTHTALLTPHWQQTREAARQHPLVLLSGDTTILDYSHHRTTEGLGPIGNGKGRGYLVHSVLALLPSPRQVLGLAYQIPLVPTPKVTGETLRQRQARRRQTDVWEEAVVAIGAPPDGVRWVHLGDRGSDLFRFLATCQAQRCDFLVRAAKNRRVTEADHAAIEADPVIEYLFPVVRGWDGKEERTIRVPASHGQPARDATVRLTWGPIRLLPPQQEKGYGPIDAWVVRVWEPAPPKGVKEPLEWILLTSLATVQVDDAWERVAQYTCRWTNEEYHSCLKTGCAIEKRNLGDQPALERLLAICAPVAIALLQLRDLARTEPERPAVEVLDPELVAVVAAVTKTPSAGMTVQAFCTAVARRGGYLGRNGDGPPGWKTLWRGWYDVHRILEGVRLARHLAPS